MRKSIVVFGCEDLCAICGRPKQANHHLIFGRGFKTEADEDGLTIPICNYCHNMADTRASQIHDNSMAEKLSKALGEVAWERWDLAQRLADAENRLDQLTGDGTKKATPEYIIDGSETRFLARFGRKFI